MIETILRYEIRTDLAYDLDNHFWVASTGDDVVRIGMDALGLDTSGTLAQLAFDSVGTLIERGKPFGTLEAEKFVGSLVAPITGEVVEVNTAAIENPDLVQKHPYGDGWMIEVRGTNLEAEMPLLTQGRDAVVEGFERKIRHYRLEGVLAE